MLPSIYYTPFLYFLFISQGALITPITNYTIYSIYYIYNTLGFFISKKATKEKKILEKFEISKITTGDNVFVIGKIDNHSLIKTIVEAQNKPINTLVTSSEYLDTFYRNKLVDNYTLKDKYDTSIIKKFIDYKKENINSFIVDDEPDGFIVLHNCINKITYDDSNLIDLLDNGLRYKAVTLVTVTNPSSILDIKSSIDYLVIMSNQHILYNQIIYEEYCKDIISREDYNSLRDFYSVIIIDFKDSGKIYYI